MVGLPVVGASSLILAAALLACGGPNHQASNHLRVIEGTPAPAADYPAVALIKPDSGGVPYAFCTGALINPRIVLTAAHCSLNSKDAVYDLKTLGVVVGESQPEQHLDRQIAVSRVLPHPSFKRENMGKDLDGAIRLKEANDIAIWELAQPTDGAKVATLVAPTAVSQYLRDGAKVLLAGFGQKSAWDSPWNPHEFATAETPFNAEYQQKTSVYAANKNGRPERRTDTIKLPALVATEFYAGAPGQPDTCKGDSGGPVFVKTAGGELRLVGVTSRGSGTCEEGGVYTLAPAFLEWLKSQAGEVTVAP